MNSETGNILHILLRWTDCINQRDVDGVCSLYAPKAVLIATFSPKPLNSPAQIRAYFEQVFTNPEVHIAIDEATYQLDRIDADLGLATGVYVWTIRSRDAVIRSVRARFSFVCRLGESAPLLHHHSSLLPD